MNPNKTSAYFLYASLSFVLIGFVWWWATKNLYVSGFFLPSPSVVLNTALKMASDQRFVQDIGVSIFRIAFGFGVAAGLAIPLGLSIGINKKAAALLEPLIDLIRYTPPAAFIPLFILWFGIGEIEKMVVISASVFFPLVLMIAASVAATPKKMIDSARTLGAGQAQIIRHVIFRQAEPQIIDHLRVCLGWAWTVLIMAEMVGSVSGIGYSIVQAQRLLQTAQVIVAIITIGLLGLVSDALIKWFHRTSYPWAIRVNSEA